MHDEVGSEPAGWPEEVATDREPSVPRWLPYLAVAVISVLSGLLARRSHAAPTGDLEHDRALIFVLATAVTGVGAFAPWWVLAIAAAGATAAAAVSGLATLVVLGVAALAAAGLAAAAQRSWRHTAIVPCVISSAAVVQVALRLEGGFHGRSSLIAAALFGVLVLGAAAAGPYAVRWVAGALAALAAVGMVAGVAGAAVVGVGVWTDATKGADKLRDGLDALAAGDATVAQDSFGQASAALSRADRHLGGAWGSLAAWVPVVAQHRTAASLVLGNAQRLADTAGAAASDLDPDALRLDGGVVDVARVAALEAPLADIDGALAQTDRDLLAARSPWLLWFVDDKLDDLSADVADARHDLETASLAARTAPAILGAEGPRRYLVVFLNPASGAGVGGAIGAFAAVTATDGQLAVERTGGLLDLIAASPPEGLHVGGPADYAALVEQVAERPADSSPPPAPDGVAPPTFWAYATRSPEPASVAASLATLYPQAGGAEVDGVVMLDPEGLAAVLDLTGPVEVPGLGTLQGTDVVDVLQRAQYATTTAADALPVAAQAVVQALLTAELPRPKDLGELLRPVEDEGRLSAWLSRPNENALLERIRATPSLPAEGEGDLLAVTVDNDLLNAIDTYIARSTDYEVTVFPGAGRVTSDVSVTLTNQAPADGLSALAIGNFVGLPVGTSRSTINVLTPFELDRARLDDQPVEVAQSHELGRNAYAVTVTLAPGASTTLHLSLTGRLGGDDGDSGVYVLDVRPQPAAKGEALTLVVKGPNGVGASVLEGPLGPADGAVRFEGEPAEPFRVRVRVA